MTEGVLVLGPRVVGGESDDSARYATLDDGPVVVKLATLDARPRFEAVTTLLERLAGRGLPVPAYRLLERKGLLVVAQSLLPGAIDGSPRPAVIGAVLARPDARALRTHPVLRGAPRCQRRCSARTPLTSHCGWSSGR